jgi:prevent-host-death family protein
MSEIRVGVRDLKSRLSEYLRQVKQGQIVIITDHGHPVGRLSPVEQPLDERMKALQDAGLVAWNGQTLKPITPAAVNRGEQQVSDILVEIRELSCTWMPARW